ncbi:unnamed protein product [Cuscuta epithymum]|uniref:BHLH domain-containing protein n=1 Tax=Cuscuta epithymum TaxID=186058 RepID=A0AAV0C9S4_9ASTE|nr:unnamed protein product [Cuscuta epithymum]
MDSEGPAAPVMEKGSTPPETVLSRDQLTKKKQGKVPKRAHKAEREKMKRDHLNDLFLSLANALELSEQVNGKASILIEATRNVKELLAQIEQLKRESEALLSETQYVSMEKKELEDENYVMEAKISDIRREIAERVAAESNLDLNLAPPGYEEQQKAEVMTMNPVYVYPICPNPELYKDGKDPVHLPHSAVSKPRARYPSPSDEWSSQILSNHPLLGEELQGGSDDSGFVRS